MKKKMLQIMLMTGITLCGFADDTIVFKNGDQLTGTILKQQENRVYFKSPAFGSVALHTRDISEIRFNTPDLGEISVPANALTAKAPAPKAITSTQKPPLLQSGKKSLLIPQAKAPKTTKKKRQWSGLAGVGLDMRDRSNLDENGKTKQTYKYETYKMYGNLGWKGKKNNLKWSWNYRYSETDNVVKDDFFNITQKYRHTFSPRYYATSKTMFQRDEKRKIVNEQLQTAELGFQWFDSKKLKLSTSGGLAYHQFDLVKKEVNESEGKLIFDQSLRWQMINSLTLFQKYTHLGDFEKYHLLFTSGLENKLIHDIFLRLEYRLDRDTEVNYDNKSYYDKVLLTSLLYKF